MIPMTIFDANCLYVLQCLALVFVAAPCVLFAGGMLICLLMWCGLRITRALHLRLLKFARQIKDPLGETKSNMFFSYIV